MSSMLPGSRQVKAFSHLGYHAFDYPMSLKRNPGRVGLAACGDDPDAMATFARVVDRIGFDPVNIGPLANSVILEGGNLLFGRPITP